MTQLEQYKKAYATLVGMVDRTISALETTPPEKMTPALTANRLKMALVFPSSSSPATPSHLICT